MSKDKDTELIGAPLPKPNDLPPVNALAQKGGKKHAGGAAEILGNKDAVAPTVFDNEYSNTIKEGPPVSDRRMEEPEY